MPQFSPRSKKNILQLDSPLQEICFETIKEVDFSVICGYRNQTDQNHAYARGKSLIRWPNSKHNQNPSRAFDFIPYPTGYAIPGEFYVVASYIFATAIKLDIPIRWGGHFKKKNGSPFLDLGHFELP